jgi:hypothetical protein
LLRAALVSLALILANAAAAQEMVAPRIDAAAMDWTRAAEDGGDLAALNAASGKRFPHIEASAVPVLLPFDVDAFRTAGEPVDADKFLLGGFTATKFFQPGPAGYDAVFTLRASETPEFSNIAYSEPIYILLSGLRFAYSLDGRLPEAAPVKDLDPSFPGVHRVWHEFVQRTVFEGGVARRTQNDDGRDHSPHACADADVIDHHLDRGLVPGRPPRLHAGGLPRVLLGDRRTRDRHGSDHPRHRLSTADEFETLFRAAEARARLCQAGTLDANLCARGRRAGRAASFDAGGDGAVRDGV